MVVMVRVPGPTEVGLALSGVNCCIYYLAIWFGWTVVSHNIIT
jgi:hypothetical protein